MIETAAVLAGYVLGSLPFGYWLPRLVHGEDIRERGSGNVGATNVFRAYGPRLGVLVALLDVGKGFAAALLGLEAGGALVGVLAAGAAMLGHWRPLFLRFAKGGKTVATAGGAALALTPLALLACAAVWLGLFVLTRYASVASIAAALCLPAAAWAFGAPWPVVVFALACAGAIVLLHRHNIRRLLGGTEHRVRLSRAEQSR